MNNIGALTTGCAIALGVVGYFMSRKVSRLSEAQAESTTLKTEKLLKHLDSFDFIGRYQPVRINGKNVRESHNWSGGSEVISLRYNAIYEILKKLYGDRPFTLLDLGANLGYFGLRIAEDFPKSCVIMMEWENFLKKICELNTDRKNIICFEVGVGARELQCLIDDGGIDVVLALHILHHMEDPIGRLEQTRQLAQHVIIETPNPNDSVNTRMAQQSPNDFDARERVGKIQSIWETLGKLQANEIASFPRDKSTSHMFHLPSATRAFQPLPGLSTSTFFKILGLDDTRRFPENRFIKKLSGNARIIGTSSYSE
jgi:hypothetical protein